MVTLNTFITTWITDLLAWMGGCFGCCTKPTPIIAVDEPSKGLRIQGRTVRKPSVSDEFWSTGTYDLENSALQSQTSLSLNTTSNPTLNQCTSNFINQGHIVWNQTRLKWIGSSRTKDHPQQSRDPRLRWNASYESLPGSRNRFPRPLPLSVSPLFPRPVPLSVSPLFPRPVPLSEMVDFLVEVWEQEGLYHD